MYLLLILLYTFIWKLYVYSKIENKIENITQYIEKIVK